MPLDKQTFLLAHPDDTKGLLYLNTDPGVVADDVMHFAIDGNIWTRVTDGVFRAAWVVNGTGDQTSRLQAVLNYAGVTEVVFDQGDVLISGTLTVPTGKKIIFHGDAKIIGTGTVTINGVLCAPDVQHIFATSLNVSIAFTEHGHVSCKWFGALGNGLNNDTAALQKAINVSIKSNILKAHLPKGTYNTDKGLLLSRDDDNNGATDFLVGFELFGPTPTYGGGPGEAIINCTNGQTFGIGVHRGKGVRVRNITVFGANTALLSATPAQVWNPSSGLNWFNGCRSYLQSPHSGFIVDPFHNYNGTAVPVGERYSGFDAIYDTDTASGGSTDIKFINCTARYWVIGFCMSPHGRPQNGDDLMFEDCWSDYNKVAFSVGQSQNRTITLKGCKCWGITETFIDCRNYGDGTGSTPEIINLQIAGAVRWLCKISGFTQNNGIIITDSQMESLYGFGGALDDNGTGDVALKNGRLTLRSCKIQLNPPIPASLLGPSYECDTPPILFIGDEVCIQDSTVWNLNGVGNKHYHCFSNIIIERSTVDFLIGNYNSLANCMYSKVRYGTTFISNDGVLPSTRLSPAETSGADYPIGLAPMIYDGETEFIGKWKRTFQPMMKGDKYTHNHNGAYVYIGAFTIQNKSSTNKTAELVLTPGSTELLHMYVGRHVYGMKEFYGAGVPARQWLDIGRVTAINAGTGIVNLEYVPEIIGNGSHQIMIYYLIRHIHNLFIGTVTAGSAVITNIEGADFAAGFGGWDTEKLVVGMKHFPPGTRVLSSTWNYGTGLGTLTLSHPATESEVGAIVRGTDFKTEWFNSSPQTAHPYLPGYKEGDIIYPGTGADPNILHWICVKSGIAKSGGLYIPEFKPVYKVDSASGGLLEGTL